ncbi:MAG TPA: DUF3667 domain-containing protein [Sphingomicrobium sp.]|nr:DUF3667 domain-containing protein [Sphingomicrobium sp.]
MGELEAVADAVTGGVLGRAVEPGAGEADGHTHEKNCLNCGAELTGPFCHQCGQHAHVHRTLSAFFHDFLHGVLHFEGKIWRTLPLLAWRPGELTRRYIDGQRASFVSPIALFLFCVFLTFAVIGLTSSAIDVAGVAADAQKELVKDQRKLSMLEAQRATFAKAGQATVKIDRKIADVTGEMAALRAVKEGKIDAATFKIQNEFLGGIDEGLGEAAKNPELLFYKIKTNAYKFSWALIPISVPFVWLLFPFNRRFRWYDHTVFVTYSLCFMMLLLSVGSIIGVLSQSVASIAWFVPPIHMYRQLRGAYGVSRWGAVWRTSVLTVFASMAIGLFASLLVGLGAFD